MKNVPIEMKAREYARRSRIEWPTTQECHGSWIPAREYNVGWNAWDAIKTRFRLGWMVFTGRADALTWD